MRVFVGIDIDAAIRERIQRFMDGVRGFAPDARWVRPESLHVTLKFIGEKPAESVDKIEQVLASIKSVPIQITFRGYGFFPTAKSARVFWIGVEAGPELPALAKQIDEATATLGIPRENHAFGPHLTLARGGNRSGAPAWRQGDVPNRNFKTLQDKLAAMLSPEFGTMTAQEFFLYESKLMRGGSQYTKIGQFSLSKA